MRISFLLPTLLFLALIGQFSTPTSAQYFDGVPEGVYEVGDPDAPLSLLQRHAVAQVREHDRSFYMAVARLSRIYRKKYYTPRHRLIKPIAEWTQGDLWAFRRNYDSKYTARVGLENWSALELAIMVDTIASDSGGSDGDGGDAE